MGSREIQAAWRYNSAGEMGGEMGGEVSELVVQIMGGGMMRGSVPSCGGGSTSIFDMIEVVSSSMMISSVFSSLLDVFLSVL